MYNEFMLEIEKLNDPLLTTIFKNANKHLEKRLVFVFSDQFKFFRDSLVESSSLWLPIVRDIYGKDTAVKIYFSNKDIPVKIGTGFNWQDNSFKQANARFVELKKQGVPVGLAMHKAAKEYSITQSELAREIGKYSAYCMKMKKKNNE